VSRAFVFSLVVASAACTEKGADGFFVLDNTAPPTTGMCTFTGDPAQPSLAQGVVSTASPGYFMAPLLQSRMNVLMGQDPTYKTIMVQGARVDLTGAVTTSYQVLAAVGLPPQGTANVPMNVIPPSIINGLTNMVGTDGVVIEATITFYGQVGGSQIEATPFVYGITVIEGGFDVLGPCPVMGATPRVGNACNPLQDGFVDCCSNTDGSLTCPATT